MVRGYARVSTKGQAHDGNGLDAQIKALTDNGATEIYQEAFTGTKTDRPEFNRLLAALEPGDTLMVTKLDRIARSASKGIELVDDLLKNGIKIHILNMGVLDNSTTGKLIRNIFFAFAEFERDMIVDRTQEGKAIAKQNPNFKEGRPKKFDEDQLKYALHLLDTKSYAEVTKITGISKSSLIRFKKQHPDTDH